MVITMEILVVIAKLLIAKHDNSRNGNRNHSSNNSTKNSRSNSNSKKDKSNNHSESKNGTIYRPSWVMS